MLRVLVTGGGGFLGRYVVEALTARGDRVRSLSRRRYEELINLGADSIVGDIRDAESVARACQGVDAVIHVAAVAGIWGDWRHYQSVNTQGTINVIEACRRHRVKRLVYCSSPSVTFDGSDQENVDETEPYPTRWLCHYPHSKALAEQHVLAANGKDGMLTCALRPHLIWGPRDEHLIPRLLDRARRGQLRIVGDGSNLIDMVFVSNAAAAHVQAMDALVDGSPAAGKAYFISQGEPVNCWEWLNEILVLAGIEPIQKSISFPWAWRIGAMLEATYQLLGRQSEPRMTRFLAAQLARHHYFNIEAAERDLGYTPQVSIARGMELLAKEIAP